MAVINISSEEEWNDNSMQRTATRGLDFVRDGDELVITRIDRLLKRIRPRNNCTRANK